MSITYKGQEYDSYKEAEEATGDPYPIIWRVVNIGGNSESVYSENYIPPERKPERKPEPEIREPVVQKQVQKTKKKKSRNTVSLTHNQTLSTPQNPKPNFGIHPFGQQEVAKGYKFSVIYKNEERQLLWLCDKHRDKLESLEMTISVHRMTKALKPTRPCQWCQSLSKQK